MLKINTYLFIFQEHIYNLHKTKEFLKPKLVIEIWDDDKFTFDDFLGKVIFLSLMHLVASRTKSLRTCSEDF